MRHPKISIIIPIYNAEQHLHDCLDSAIKQSMTDIEIICIDDFSTDKSAEILLDYTDRDNRITCIRHDSNKGEGAARNTGLDNAHGDYIFHLDADDTIPSNAMELLYEYASKHGSEMVKGRYTLIHPGGEIEPQAWSTPDQDVINTNIRESSFLQEIPTSHCTYLYSRNLLEKHSIRYNTDMSVGLDIIYLATALTNAKSVTLIPDNIYNYKQTEGSAVRGKVTPKVAHDSIKMKEIVADLLLSRDCENGAHNVLQSWEHIINTHWTRIPSNFSTPQCVHVFSDFRKLIRKYHVTPWREGTDHHIRYLLTLILSDMDIEAISFLSSKESLGGFTSSTNLKNALELVLEKFPDDIGALAELAYVERRQGRPEKAMQYFKKIIVIDKENFSAPIQLAITLMSLGEYEDAKKELDSATTTITNDDDLQKKIRKAIKTQENLSRLQSDSEHNKSYQALQEVLNKTQETLNKTNKDLSTVKQQLNDVYNSKSWRITAPLRKLMRLISKQ